MRTAGVVFAPQEFYSNNKAAGQAVNEQSALGISPLYRALSVMAGKAAAIDINVIETTGTDDAPQAKKRKDHPIYKALNISCNDLYPANSLIKFLVWNMKLHGNGLAWIKQRYPVLKIYGLMPANTILMYQDGEWVYQTTAYITADGEIVSNAINSSSLIMGGRSETFFIPMSEVIHIRNCIGNQLVGYSILDILKQAVGEQVALQDYSANAWKNGCQVKTIVELPQGFNGNDKAKVEAFRNMYEGTHKGTSNANRTAMLQQGSKAYTLGMNNEQIQWASARETLSPLVVSQLTGVPQHLLGVVAGSSQYKNEEEKTASFENFTMGEIFDSLEAEADMKLLSENEKAKGTLCVKFDRAQMIQHDIETLDKIAVSKLASGRSTINEYLASISQKGIGPDGDERFIPTTLQSLDTLINPPPPPAPVMGMHPPGASPAGAKPAPKALPGKDAERMIGDVQEHTAIRLIKRLRKSVEAKPGRNDLVEYHRDVLIEAIQPLSPDADVITDSLLADLQAEVSAVLPEQLRDSWDKYEERLLKELQE